ncbi:unnamed protein product [Mucor hiemalis]
MIFSFAQKRIIDLNSGATSLSNYPVPQTTNDQDSDEEEEYDKDECGVKDDNIETKTLLYVY